MAPPKMDRWMQGIEARLAEIEKRPDHGAAIAALQEAVAGHEGRLTALEGEAPEEPKPVALTVTPAADLRDDAVAGTTVATYETDGSTVAISGTDAAVLAVEAGRIVTASSITRRTALAFALAATAPGRATATWSGSVAVAPTVVEPPVEPGTDLTNPSVGAGLEGMTDWSTEMPFIDIQKLSRAWTATRTDYGDTPIGSAQDQYGHLLRMPEGAVRVETVLLTDYPAAMVSAAGRFRVRVRGRGRMVLPHGSGEIVVNGPAEHWFTNVPNGHAKFLGFTQIDPADPIRILDIVHERNIAAFARGEVFEPRFLARLKDFRTLRFMDWMHTNGSRLARWADRPTLQHRSWTENGPPLEVMIDLANRVGADPWLCIPHMADDDFVARFAEMVKARLRADLCAYIEYSNETWNYAGAFTQSRWCEAEGLKRWPNEGGVGAGHSYVTGRTVEIARIFARVWAGARRRRYKIVRGIQTGNAWLADYDLTARLWREWDRAHGGDGSLPSSHFDVLAVTGYFDGDLNDGARPQELMQLRRDQGEAAAIAKALDYLGQAAARCRTIWAEHKAQADAHGLELAVYEAGGHADPRGQWQENADYWSLLAAVHRSAGMAPIYRRLLDDWKAVGGTAFCIFVAIGRWTKHGFWGHLEHLDDRSPRWDAILAWSAANPGWWEERAPGAFLGRA